MKQGIYKVDIESFCGTFVEEVELVQLALSLSIYLDNAEDFIFTGRNIQLMTTDREVITDFIDYDLSVGFNPFEYKAFWEERFSEIKGVTEENFDWLNTRELLQKIYAFNKN